MAEIVDYNVSAGSNNSASPNGMPENMSPSGVNNAWREHAARHKRHWKDMDGSVTVAGTSTAMTATLNKGTTTLADIGPMILEFIASGSAPTLAVNGGTAKNLCWPDGTNVAANEIALGTRHMVLYDADKDKFVVMTPSIRAGTVPTLTTRGDLLTMNSTPALSRLAIGSASTVLRTDGSDPSWGKVAGAHIAMGSDAQGDILYYNGTAYARLGAGTSGQYLKTQGSGANPTWANLGTLATAVSISGSATTTWTGIPAGVNYIVVTFDGISNGSTDNVLVQIGDSGGLETTGYTSASSQDVGSDVSSTSGFILQLVSTAANVLRGVLWLVRSTGNVWVSAHSGMIDQDEGIHGGGARTTLDSALDRVAVLSTASNNFDAGTVNIVYW